MVNSPLVIVDIETTGGTKFTQRIIELAGVRVEHGEIVQVFNSLINPDRSIPPFISEFTGITDKDVATAPNFATVADDFLNLCEDAIFVAHNSNFDYGVLGQEYERLGYGFVMDTLCTVRLSRRLFAKERHHNLDAIINRCGIICSRRHRALDDAMAVNDFLNYLTKAFSADDLAKTINSIIKRPLSRSEVKTVMVADT